MLDSNINIVSCLCGSRCNYVARSHQSAVARFRSKGWAVSDSRKSDSNGSQWEARSRDPSRPIRGSGLKWQQGWVVQCKGLQQLTGIIITLPIRGHYPGHVVALDQWEASVLGCYYCTEPAPARRAAALSDPVLEMSSKTKLFTQMLLLNLYSFKWLTDASSVDLLSLDHIEDILCTQSWSPSS